MRAFILILLFILPNLGWAQGCMDLDFGPVAYPQLATSGRALAMGNAYISKVDDSAAPFYNAAGLGTVRPTNFHLTDIHFESSQDYLTMPKGTTSDFWQGAFGNVTIEGTRVNLKDNIGDVAYSRFNILPNFTMRYFSFGYLLSQQSRMTILSDTSPYEWAFRFDQGPYLSINFSFFGGVIKVGAMGVWLIRRELYGCGPQDETVFIEEDDYAKGNGFFSDMGVRVTLPTDWIPAFSLSFHNAFGGSFNVTQQPKLTVYNPNPRPLQNYANTMDLGVSITPRIGKLARLHIEVNLNDLLGKFDEVDTLRRLLIGGEYDWERKYFIRLGMVDGYVSGGFGFKSRHFNFALSTYGAELDPTGWHVKQERRYLIAFDFGI
ncbi:MAG: hypothetical protein E2O68_02425 [Deltaproteobacteria bacterium]|nr:MAG: hypothetical protein E2O68_02425 [Deltaproteobacteria bacterium]